MIKSISAQELVELLQFSSFVNVFQKIQKTENVQLVSFLSNVSCKKNLHQLLAKSKSLFHIPRLIISE